MWLQILIDVTSFTKLYPSKIPKTKSIGYVAESVTGCKSKETQQLYMHVFVPDKGKNSSSIHLLLEKTVEIIFLI